MTHGIDVSAWQGKIDFNKVKKSGYEFVILKAGGNDDGYYIDGRFETNYFAAKKSGLKVGAYYFVNRDFSAKNAQKLAEVFYNIVKNKTFDFPLFIDVETTPTSERTTVTTGINIFCNYLQKKGYMSGVYASAISGFVDRININDLSKNIYKWVASYSYKPSNAGKNATYCIWQKSSTGRVNGINGNVDINECYVDFKSATDINNKTLTIDNIHDKYYNIYKRYASDVISGKYENGTERKNKLVSLNIDYNYCQSIVNEMINKSAKTAKATAKTKYNKIANDIISGKYGNGEKRFTNLKNANFDYNYAQMLVNNIMKG
ncbi:MAG: GH25 family lysozyme [Hominilimicola sp.]|uniref:GH25 family lysozyme n=1 Tax=Hominilimicola sp. TaxID=3073571 RepID=UPI003994879F